MIIFLTVKGTEFQTPGNSVEYNPSRTLGEEALFEVREKDNWKLVGQVRAREVVGWWLLEETEGEPE